MTTPPVALTIEPFENGTLHYLPVSPKRQGEPPLGMLAFRLVLRNLEPEGSVAPPLRLESVLVEFKPVLGQAFSAPARIFENDSDSDQILHGEKAWIYYPEVAPGYELPSSLIGSTGATATITVNFRGDYDPVILRDLPLVPHQSPTSQGSYRFPGMAKDLRFDEYFVPNEWHAGWSEQAFAYDIHCEGFSHSANALSPKLEGKSGAHNEDYRCWDKPVYAMADGTVLQAVDGNPDNPVPGRRAIVRIGQDVEESVDAFAAAAIGDTHLVVAASVAGNLQVIAYEATGTTFERRGDAGAGAAQQVSIAGWKKGVFVTASTSPGGAVRLDLWKLYEGTTTIELHDSREFGSAQATAFVVLDASEEDNRRVVLVTRTPEGTLGLALLIIEGLALPNQPACTANAGAVAEVSAARLSGDVLVTAVRTSSGKQKLILWNWSDEQGGKLTRGADLTLDAVSSVAVTAVSGAEDGATDEAEEYKRSEATLAFATTARNAAGTLVVRLFEVQGTISQKAEAKGGKITGVAACGSSEDCFYTPVRTQSGTLKVIAWKISGDAVMQLTREGEAFDGSIDSLAAVKLGSNAIATVVRTAGGTLRTSSWRAAPSNCVKILHGDPAHGSRELVCYFHLRNGSLNEDLLTHPMVHVKAGDFLGRIGSSGRSSRPHLHIHALRVPDGFDEDQLLEKLQAGVSENPSFPARPLPFHGACALGTTHPVRPWREYSNPFHTLNRQGVYFEPTMAIWPGATTPGIPTELNELVFFGVPLAEHWALIAAVTAAGYRLVSMQYYAAHWNMVFWPQDGSEEASMKLCSQANTLTYAKALDAYTREGLRPILVDSYIFEREVHFSALFVESSGPAWRAYHHADASTHESMLADLRSKHYVPVSVSVVMADGKPSITALYEERPGTPFLLEPSLTPKQFDAKARERLPQGWVVDHLDAYDDRDGVRFAAIWRQSTDRSCVTQHGLTERELRDVQEQRAREGFRTKTIVGYTVTGSPRFAGVWNK